jgi:hypothetical protein
MYQMTTKYIKWHKIHQMATIIPENAKISIHRTSKRYQNLISNIPSGNPGSHEKFRSPNVCRKRKLKFSFTAMWWIPPAEGKVQKVWLSNSTTNRPHPVRPSFVDIEITDRQNVDTQVVDTKRQALIVYLPCGKYCVILSCVLTRIFHCSPFSHHFICSLWNKYTLT